MPQGTKSRSGSEQRKKTYSVTTRYDADEYAELEASASRVGLTLASYQRVQSLARPKTRSTRRPSIEKELLARTLAQFGKIGSNLNQIARAANMNKDERAGMDDALAELKDAAQLVAQHLGRAP